MDAIITVLESFHHKISRHIVGIMTQRGDGGELEWASVDAALEVTGIWSIREYVQRR